jgi:isocitrate lyase
MVKNPLKYWPSRNTNRWKGIVRPYTPADIDRLKGTVHVEYSLARAGAEKFWNLLHSQPLIQALGTLNGSQAVEVAQAGMKAIYLSVCQLSSGSAAAYGDASNPAHSVSAAVRVVNHALLRADQLAHSRRQPSRDWMLPIVAEGDTVSGDSLGSFDATRNLVEAGAAAVHFDDQLPAARSCGPMEAKTLIPVEDAIQKLVAARLAADVMQVPTVIIARTDAESAGYISSNHDPRDQKFLMGERLAGGNYLYRGGLQAAIDRALAYAPYADLLWCESAELNLEDARKFAHAIHAQFPGKLLAYNCSPRFHWRAKLNEDDIACFQRDLAAIGYRFQFISLAGYHMLNLSMYQFAKDYLRCGMTAYSQIQQLELDMAKQLGHDQRLREEDSCSSYLAEVGAANIPDGSYSAPKSRRLRLVERGEVDGLDYNDDEATERTPMPHLYPSPEPAPLPSAAAAD